MIELKSKTGLDRSGKSGAFGQLTAQTASFSKQGPVFRNIFGSVAALWTGLLILGFFALRPNGVFPTLLCIGIPGYIASYFVGAVYWTNRLQSMMDYPTLEASSDNLRRGQDVELVYRQAFKKDTPIESLRVALVLQEWVRYSCGTNTCTDTQDIVEDEWFIENEAAQRGQTFEQRFTLRVPPDAIHTWHGNDNRLSWFIRVELDLPGWIDYRDTYPVTVEGEANHV